MATATLTEQMGAMAIIDELRHTQLEVQKHLDLPARRKAVAARIREFYQAKGIAVDDEVVERGVREYFSSRLTYESRPASAFQLAVARLYVTRDRWGKKTAAIVLASFVSLLAISFVVDAYLASVLEAEQAAVERLVSEKQLLAQQVVAQMLRAEEVDATLSGPAAKSSKRMIAQVKGSKAQFEQLLAVPVPEAPTELPDGFLLNNVAKQERDVVWQKLGAAFTLLRANEDLLLDIERLKRVVLDFDVLVSQPGFAAKAEASPLIGELAGEFRLAVEKAGEPTAPSPVLLMRQLEAAIVSYDELTPLRDELFRHRSWLAGAGLSAQDQALFAGLFAAVESGVGQLAAPEAEVAMGDLRAMVNFAAKELTLRVVSRAGEKSLIERQFDSTGGKSWYLLTEALDATGDVVPAPVISSETQRKSFARVFGVRVPQAVYLAVRADKAADGHVDQPAMGRKQANSLTLSFDASRQVVGAPDMITEW